MGLGFQVDGIIIGEAGWSYPGFHTFRKRLASQIGINLDQMEGFTETPKYLWKDVKDDVKYLLHHSDCDGKLSPSKCAKIAPRLKELITEWNEDVFGEKYRAFILSEAMKLAVSKNKPLVFC